jgi:hypothetical protein
MLNDMDAALFSLALAGLACAVLLVCWRVRDLEQDIEIIRLLAPVTERDG